MWKFKAIVTLVLLVAVAGVGMVISANNREQVSPNIFGFELATYSLGSWLFFTLLAGVLLGYFVAFVSSLKQRSQKARLARKLKRCEQELGQLRTTALRD